MSTKKRSSTKYARWRNGNARKNGAQKTIRRSLPSRIRPQRHHFVQMETLPRSLGKRKRQRSPYRGIKASGPVVIHHFERDPGRKVKFGQFADHDGPASEPG